MSTREDERRKTEGTEGELSDEGCGEHGSRGVVRRRDPKMPTEQERKDHEVTHSNKNCFSCAHCDIISMSLNPLKVHEETCEDSKKPYSSHCCDKKFQMDAL